MSASDLVRSSSLRVAGLVLGAFFLQSSLPGNVPAAHAIETPAYTVLQSNRFEGNTVELRGYAPYLIAETTVEADDFDEASSEGFRRLAAFIFGENNGNVEMDMTSPVETRRPEKMDMTSPVETTGEPGAWEVRFVMPSKYTLETLPRPNDTRIRIVEVPARTVAALSFSGRWTSSNFAEHTDRLKRFVTRTGLRTQGAPLLARYNMPLTPWFLRRNEILLEVLR